MLPHTEVKHRERKEIAADRGCTSWLMLQVIKEVHEAGSFWEAGGCPAGKEIFSVPYGPSSQQTGNRYRD
jgi:hypothetical protein